MIILGYDGLEITKVDAWNLENIKQRAYGKTDISMLEEPRTVVIWSSFLTGRNTEAEVKAKSPSLKESLWTFKLQESDTFLSDFGKTKAIDVPSLTYMDDHRLERDAMAGIFDKTATIEDYDRIAFENHRKVKEEFMAALEEDWDLLFGYFGVADVVGHMSFGIDLKMKLIYKQLDDIAKTVVKKKPDEPILIISDHGMYAEGRFGDHTRYGFWSLNRQVDWNEPKIYSFRNMIKTVR
ncbi:MAG TPA: hypothetical protein ENN13_02250 [Candidatus Altiarchaeales archaeon]|nr:hypothetical protein [Candidatus Altiarchaeales archaeon]